jgi:hypothetical protein
MEALKEKIRRGLVLTQVPVGYIRTEDEGMEKTPDRQIQEAIGGIFRKFRELGSVRQVLLWYRDEKLLIPALSRELAGLLRCGRCGRALPVIYVNSKQHGPLPRYGCNGDRSRQPKSCLRCRTSRLQRRPPVWNS